MLKVENIHTSYGAIEALRGVGVKMTKEQIGTELCDRVTVPNGFVTDLASVPRAMWWLIALTTFKSWLINM